MPQATFPLQALGEYLLVKLDPEEKMSGLIELTPEAIEPVFTGAVVSVGPDVPPALTVGCRVRWLFPLGSCFKLPGDDDTQYARIHESDLVGILLQESPLMVTPGIYETELTKEDTSGVLAHG